MFSDYLAAHTNKEYIEFNNILKQIALSNENLTKISFFYNEYKIIEANTDKEKQKLNLK